MKHPQMTLAQVEIWLDNPVTKVYLQCLQWHQEQLQEAMGKGGYVNSHSSDITFAQAHANLGEQEGLRKAADPENILNTHNMIGDNDDQDI